MADFDCEIIEPGILVIKLTGTIEQGDSQRLQEFIEPIRQQYGAPEGPTSITISFNSGGGNYLEGIELGRLLNTHGYRSLVKAGNRCHSAAAIAFLGGAGLGATGGWYPDRVMEYGALIGFHSFRVALQEQGPIAKIVDVGKFLTTALINYAHALRIDIAFILETLHTPATDLMLLKLAKHLRQLRITLLRYPNSPKITEQRAVLAANYATNWQRPIKFPSDELDGQTSVSLISATEFKRRILTRVEEKLTNISGNIPEGLPTIIAGEISQGKGNAVERIFSELIQLSLLPYMNCPPNQQVYLIEGFFFGAGFYTMEFFVWDDNQPYSSEYLTVLMVSTINDCKVISFSKNGDILYELHDPNENVVGVN